MPVEAAIVAKNEFIEISGDVLAVQAVIGAEAPSFHQRESPMNPRQDNVACHLADDAWIVPIAGQARIGCSDRTSGHPSSAWFRASRRPSRKLRLTLPNWRRSWRGERGQNAYRGLSRACVAAASVV